MKTIGVEQLPTETRTLVEGWLSEENSITLSRGDFPFARLTHLKTSEKFFDLTPDEEAELQEVFREGDEDFAASRYVTLEEFKRKHANRQDLQD